MMTIDDVTQKRHVSFPFVCAPDEAIREYLTQKHPLPGTQRCNYVLHKATAHLKTVNGRSATTYSFRRLFEHRIIKWYTSDDGTVAWMKVIQWSGHKDERVLKGSYGQAQNLVIPHGAKLFNVLPTEPTRKAQVVVSSAIPPTSLMPGGLIQDPIIDRDNFTGADAPDPFQTLSDEGSKVGKPAGSAMKSTSGNKKAEHKPVPPPEKSALFMSKWLKK